MADKSQDVRKSSWFDLFFWEEIVVMGSPRTDTNSDATQLAAIVIVVQGLGLIYFSGKRLL